MSHYTVGVIVKGNVEHSTIEELVSDALAPFDESLEVDPYVSITREQIKEEHVQIVKAIETGVSDRYNVEYLRENKESYLEFDTFLETYYGDREFDENGGILSTYNPKSKWDWYSIGGRWDQSLPTKDGHMVNDAQIKDIKLKSELDDKGRKEVEETYKKLTTEGDFYKPEYYKEKYPTLECYIENMTSFSTYALLDAEGNWYEPGQMGWFGCSAATPKEEGEFKNKFAEILSKANPEDYLVIVDCHI